VALRKGEHSADSVDLFNIFFSKEREPEHDET